MQPLPRPIFDIYALSLPRGHAFGDRPPVEAWQSDDALAWGAVTRDLNDRSFGIQVMRRREDHVWVLVRQEHGFSDLTDSRTAIKSSMKEGASPEPIRPNTARRPALHDVQGREPSEIFMLLSRPSHHVAAWLLNQVYLAFPNPDESWAGDCQTENFHTRMWEAHLLACLREQGLLVTQPHPSPDFRIETRRGDEAWIEAVTANPSMRYNQFNAPPTNPPEDARERLLGPAALRFAKTLGNKLQKGYNLLPHVAGKAFAIALADFHAPGSMVWSREALISYLYGIYVAVTEVDGRRIASSSHVLREFNSQCRNFVVEPEVGLFVGSFAARYWNTCVAGSDKHVSLDSFLFSIHAWPCSQIGNSGKNCNRQFVKRFEAELPALLLQPIPFGQIVLL